MDKYLQDLSPLSASSLAFEPGQILHQGVLRRKKQRRSLFESAYKQVVLCRIEASVLRGSKRVRVYLHEREREGGWGTTASTTSPFPGAGVSTFKAENREEAAVWIRLLVQAQTPENLLSQSSPAALTCPRYSPRTSAGIGMVSHYEEMK